MSERLTNKRLCEIVTDFAWACGEFQPSSTDPAVCGTCDGYQREDDCVGMARELLARRAADLALHRCAGCGHKWEGPAAPEICGDCHRELQARRAADPTPAQRAWYRDQAEEFGIEVPGYAGRAGDAYFDVNAAAECARLAAHFGRLALDGGGDDTK